MGGLLPTFSFQALKNKIAITPGGALVAPDSDAAGLYHVTVNPDTLKTVSRRTSTVNTKYGGVNGMLNDLQYAQNPMAEHIQKLLNKEHGGEVLLEFTLFFNPTEGFFRDLSESMQDKVGITSDVAKQFAAVLEDTQAAGKRVTWVAHSQAGIIFTEAVRYSGKDLSLARVAFHAGGNNRFVTKQILDRAGVSNIGHLDNPYDIVPTIAGLNTLNPIRILGSLFQIPNVIEGGRVSPHTYPADGVYEK